MPRTRPQFAPAFRRQMVELVRAGRTPRELSREFEPCYETIRHWVRQADRNEGGDTSGLTPAEREELRQVKREPALRGAPLHERKNHGVTSGNHALKTNPVWFRTRTRISLILEGISQALTLSTNFSRCAKVVRS